MNARSLFSGMVLGGALACAVTATALQEAPLVKAPPLAPQEAEKARAEALLKREMAARVLAADEGTEALIKAVYDVLKGLPTDKPAFTLQTAQGPQGGDLSPEHVQAIFKSDIPFEAKKALLVLYGRNAYLWRRLGVR